MMPGSGPKISGMRNSRLKGGCFAVRGRKTLLEIRHGMDYDIKVVFCD